MLFRLSVAWRSVALPAPPRGKSSVQLEFNDAGGVDADVGDGGQ